MDTHHVDKVRDQPESGTAEHVEPKQQAKEETKEE